MSWSIVTVPAIGRRAPADEHLAAGVRQVAGHAVGVPDRHGRDPSRPGASVAQAVREAGAGVERLHVRHPGLERQRRPERHPVGQLRRRRDAVDGDAGADEVEASPVAGNASRPAEFAACTTSGRSPAALEVGEDGLEAVELLGRVRVVGLVGHREVRAARPRAAARRARDRPVGEAPRASSGAHPTRCIPVSTLRCTASGGPPRPARPPPSPAPSMPARRVDDGRQPVLHDRRGRFRRRLGQHEDRRVDARPRAARRPPRRARRRARPRRPRAPPGRRARRRGRSRRPSRPP